MTTTEQTPSQPPQPQSGSSPELSLGAWLAAQTQVQPSQADPYALQLAACKVLGLTRAQLITHPEQELSATHTRQLDSFAARLHAGEPWAYLSGSQEFWSLELLVTNQVLIPRPETELLVELAVAKATARLALNPAATFVELGTGSGAISIALAHELHSNAETQRYKPTYIATDYSSTALAIAQDNAKRLGVDLLFVQADWLAALTSGIDMLVANPPYIAANDPHLAALTFEPSSALISGADGLDALRSISAQAAERLQPGGWLLLEHGYNQAQAVQQMLRSHGLQAVTTKADLAGLDRVTLGQQPPP